ncbi:MAG: hypothetical protein IKG01_13570 [Lachnospiraceae bacterium]|nr:hypothetical protein [Lachnospiraceae bacterium]
MRLIDADPLLKAVKENKELYERERLYLEGLLLNAPTVEPKLSDEQIEKIADLLEIEWGYEGIREDISRILRGKEE